MSDLITTTKRENDMTQARTTLVATVTFSTERAGWTIDFVDGVSSTTNGSWTVQKYLERFAYFNTRFEAETKATSLTFILLLCFHHVQTVQQSMGNSVQKIVDHTSMMSYESWIFLHWIWWT